MIRRTRRVASVAGLLAAALLTSGCPVQCGLLEALIGSWELTAPSGNTAQETLTFNMNGTFIRTGDPFVGASFRTEATWQACWRGSSDRGTIVLMVTYDGIPDDENAEIDPPEEREWMYEIAGPNTIRVVKDVTPDLMPDYIRVAP